MQRILRELTRAWMVWVLLCLATQARAASPDEAKAFEVAVRFFEDRAYDLAEREFAEFIRLHPGSGRVAEALLLQGQALYVQGRYGECLDLLRGRMETAGVLGDLYLYWTAESLYQLGRNQEAVEYYGAVLSNHPESSRRLEASLGEAYATFRLGNLRRTAELLRTQEGAFQQAAADGNPELVARGQLLLAEVCLELGDYLGGIDALTRLPEPGLPPELTWQRQYVLARLQLGSRQVPAALVTVTNLLAQLGPLTNAAAVQLRADARSLEGVLLERSRQPEAAIQAYERNLETEVSPERRFEAVQQIVRLTLVQTRVEEAVARLEDYLRKYPADPLASLLRLALGELRLRQYYGLASNARRSGTNLLQQARVQFGMVITNVGGPYVARAHLNRGWTFWEEAQVTGSSARVADGISDLRRAAEQLPVSEEQAIARFKLGDLLYLQEDYAGAMTNYWQVATNYAELPAVSESLADQARYQLIRAAIATNDLSSAKAALEPLLEKAGHPLADRSLLLFGQAVGRVDSGEARQLLTQLIESFPDSGLVPEVKLAIARTYQHEGNWAAAGTEYDRWVTNYPGHSSLARAEFDRAWARYLAGNETNAFQIFTNFVAQYPRHALTRWAQHWIADYYYRQEKFDLADLNYQQIFLNTNWTTTDLSYHSRLMAGRSAFFRQGYNDARNYFTNLIMDDACPEAIKPEAYFELGNTIMSEKSSGTDPLERYGKAIVAFEKIPQLFPRSLFAPLAWGQIGNCHLQLATADPAQLDRAFEAYTNVLASPTADVSARSAAEIGAATVFEKRAAGASDEMKRVYQNEALSRYLSVFYGGHLREGETADPALVKEAGLAAARLAEDQGRWEVATRVYQQLSELLPSMRGIAEARLQRIQQLVSRQER